MKHTLQVLIHIFKPEGYDWMNFATTKKNPYTYHHIVENENGGEKSIENGAILTKKAHSFLHFLQWYYPDAYNDLQNVFARINASGEPVTQEYVNEIDKILEKVLVTKEYKIASDKQVVDTGSKIKLGERIPDRDLIWESSNERVATVDSNGIVTGIRPGEVNIVATNKNGVEMYNDIIRVIDLYSFCAHYNSKRKIKKLG